MGRRREREWKIELDGESIENALEKGAKDLEQSLKNFKGVKLSVSSNDDDDDDDDKRKVESRRRPRWTKTDEQAVQVPPETQGEHRARLWQAAFSPVALMTLGGMTIASFATGGSDVSAGLALGAIFMYIAFASGEYRTMGALRDRRVRKQILAGEYVGEIPALADRSVKSTSSTSSKSAATTRDPDSPRAQMEALIARIKTRLDPDQPAVSISELARYSEIASHYETKAAEIRAYLNEVGGVGPAQTDLARLRVQLEQYPPDDPRIESTTKLISIKEQTVRNLQSLARYLATVEGKFHEQIAHLESLDSALMRHKLGTFARQTHAEETLSTREVSSLAQGLTETADALEHDLQRINLELA